MLDQAQQDFTAGGTLVILDGSYSRRKDRDQVRRMAKAVGAQCFFVLCVCRDEEVRRRLALRERDSHAISDGRWEIYLHQKETFVLPAPGEEEDCFILDTEQSLEGLLTLLNAHPLLNKSA